MQTSGEVPGSRACLAIAGLKDEETKPKIEMAVGMVILILATEAELANGTRGTLVLDPRAKAMFSQITYHQDFLHPSFTSGWSPESALKKVLIPISSSMCRFQIKYGVSH